MGEAINLVNNFKVEKVIFNCGEFNELEQDLIKVLDKKKIPYYSCIKELNISDNKLYFLNNKDYGNEYWFAMELKNILGYHQWRSINDLVERAKVACQESKHNIDDHFAEQRKMIKLAKGAIRNVIDYKLSRYACYLIVQNADSRK